MGTPTIDSVAAAARLLKHLSLTPSPIGVREISRKLGTSAARTQKILNTLLLHGFVEQQPDTRRYSLSLSLWNLGASRLSQIGARTVGRPYLEELARSSGETVFLGVRNGLEAVYIDKVEGDHLVRMNAELGARRPLNSTAIGKAILAYMTDEEIEASYSSGAFRGLTQRSITSLNGIRAEIRWIRKLGYALDNEEFAVGVRCIAAPVFDHLGHATAAVSISGPANRLTRGAVPKLSVLVQRCTARISKALGSLEHIGNETA